MQQTDMSRQVTSLPLVVGIVESDESALRGTDRLVARTRDAAGLVIDQDPDPWIRAGLVNEFQGEWVSRTVIDE
ncbi:hypothetical protein Q5W_09835 [Hydrogenophaga sp. PBC]|nr:hypothetical protein Q5W_09835 [Hydrogenophaga sp. PBC]